MSVEAKGGNGHIYADSGGNYGRGVGLPDGNSADWWTVQPNAPQRGFPPDDHECREPLTDAELLAEIECKTAASCKCKYHQDRDAQQTSEGQAFCPECMEVRRRAAIAAGVNYPEIYPVTAGTKLKTKIAHKTLGIVPPADHECQEPLTDAALAAGIRAQVERLTVLMNIARGRGIQVNFCINDAGVPGGDFKGTVDIQRTEVL